MWVTEAWAEGEGLMASSSSLTSLLFILALMGLMYFMVIRPQSKKTKEHQQLISSLQVEDEIVTIGGIYGIVVKLDEQMVTIKTSKMCEIIVQRSAIAQILPRGTLKNFN